MKVTITNPEYNGNWEFRDPEGNLILTLNGHALRMRDYSFDLEERLVAGIRYLLEKFP